MRLIKKIFILLICLLLIANTLPEFRAEPAEAATISGGKVILADFSNGNVPGDVLVTDRNSDVSTNAEIDTSVRYKGKSSLSYTFNTTSTHIIMPYDFAAYGEYDLLKMRVYAPVGGQKINILVNEEITASASSDKGCHLTVHETNGRWQEYSVKVSELEKYWASTPENLYVMLNCSAWNIYPGAEEQLGETFLKSGKTYTYSSIKGETFHIDAIWLEDSSYDMTEDVTAGSKAVYAGSCKAYDELSEVWLDEATEYADGITYAPLSLFEKLFGMTSDGTSLSDGELTVTFTAGKATSEVGAYVHRLSAKAYEKDGMLYVPLEDVCALFEIPFKSDGRLAVMGSEDDIKSINEYESCGVNVATEKIAARLDEHSGQSASSADCEAVITNWITTLVGNETINDTSDSNVKSKLDSLESTATGVRALIIKEESTELFTDQTSTATSHMSTTAKRIYQMACAYAAYGCSLYMDEELLADILYSLEWFYRNRYGENEINGTGWHSTSGFNWYDWKLATPGYLIPALMMVRNVLTDEQISDYLKCFNYVSPTVYSSGANYMNACKLIIGAAALEGDAARLMEYREYAEEAFAYVDNGRFQENLLDSERAKYTVSKGHGFYKDGSYIFHTLHAMNGSYGLSHLGFAAELVNIFDGTSLEISKQYTDNMADWVLNSFDSCIYGARMMRMVLGRAENPDELSQVKEVMTVILSCFDKFDEADRIKLGSLVRYYASFDEALFLSAIPPEHTGLFNEIVSYGEYTDYRYDFSNVFGNIDKVLHRRADWGIGVSMSSSRIFNYESINSQNQNGWYLGDGRTELILKDEAALPADLYWSGIDYYRLPGTTVDTQKREAVSIGQGKEYLSSKDFVGGVELGGKYSAAAMHLESYHNETASSSADNGYGGGAPVHTNDLTAKKSYFMFDEETVCLGAEINASNNNGAEVLTVVDNRFASCYGSTRLRPDSAGKSKQTTVFDIKKFGVSSNWAAVSTIKIPIYSSEANGEVINVVICKDKSKPSLGYFLKKITVDWTGWKLVEIPRSEFESGRGLKSWLDINSMYFNLGGWSNPATKATTDLYFSKVTAYNSKGKVIAEIPFDRRDAATLANAEFSADMRYSDTPDMDYLATDSGDVAYFANDTELDGTTWFNVGNKIGYWFPLGSEGLRCRLTSHGYFESRITHGTNPSDGSYAYVLLPNKTADETSAYANSPDVEILANTGDVQAVRYNKENIISIVFWKEGSFEGITVSKPMMVMVKDDGKEITLAASDPTHKLTDATITLEKPLLLSYADSRITLASSEDKTVLNIDFAEALGSSLEAKLKADDIIISSLEFFGSDGEKLSGYLAHTQSSVTAKLRLSNLEYDAGKVRAFAALYDNSGTLQKVQMADSEAIGSGDEYETEFTIEPNGNTSRIEIFAWGSESLKPCGILYRNKF